MEISYRSACRNERLGMLFHELYVLVIGVYIQLYAKCILFLNIMLIVPRTDYVENYEHAQGYVQEIGPGDLSKDSTLPITTY